MRHLVVVMTSTSLLMLTACGGGGGVEALGSVTPPKVDLGTLSPNPTATPTPGATPTPTPAHFLDVSSAVTLDAIGGFQSFTISDTGLLYQGSAATVDKPSGTVTYDPRDGVFTVTLDSAGVSGSGFQDPAHRTDFTPAAKPANEVPKFDTYNYLVARTTDSSSTFFYQRPGAFTKYVSLAGYVSRSPTVVGRGAFAFGTKTSDLQVPTTGSGAFSGQFLATMVRGGSFDNGAGESPIQWITGTSTVNVNFAARSVAFGVTGTVGQTYSGDTLVADATLSIPTGSTFAATGTATLSATANAFAGKFASAGFTVGGTAVPVDFQSVNPTNSTAGASSIDGAFYGPNAAEVGGSFRIVGGVPDQRVDILGGFVGKR